MRPRLLSALLVAFGLTSRLSAAEIVFRVHVPSTTPPDATIFISGSTSSLGAWKADGVRLVRDGQAWTARVPVESGTRVEFKLTLGTWTRCEVDSEGKPRANRVVDANSGPTIVDLTVDRWRDAPASTRTGDIRELAIGAEGGATSAAAPAEPILVWRPAGYDDAAARERRYPVVYFLDGQNMFDAATSFAGEWKADEAAAALIAAHEIEPAILVAIPNTPRRTDECSVDRDEKRNIGGSGRAFLRTLVETIKPATLWIDMGTAEGGDDAPRNVERARSLGALFADDDHVRTTIVDGTAHDGIAWSKRLSEVLRFLLPPTSRPLGFPDPYCRRARPMTPAATANPTPRQ